MASLRMFRGISLALSILACAASAGAEQAGARRGLITTASCPFDCAMAGVAKDSCRSWQAGDECYVEDLSQGPGHRSLLVLPEGMRAPASAAMRGGMRRDGQGTWITVPRAEGRRGSAAALPPVESGKRGLVTTAQCPYGCAAAGVPESHCRSWTDGDLCYVEDLLQAPGHRSMLSVP